MKKQVLSLLLAGALTLGLFGCSAQTPEESGVPQSAPAQTEGTDSAGVVEELKIGICKEVTPRTLASESGSFGRMNYNAFCAGTWLVRDENNEMQPNLMTSWEILDKGSTIRATFATDQGITWHDGEPFTIDDVIFTVDLMNNKLKSGYLSKITGVEKVDDTTVDFQVADGAAYFTLGNSAVFVRMYPKHIWEGIEDPSGYTGEDAVIGCGPYKLVQVDEEAQTMHYEAVGETYMGRALTVRSVTVRSYDSQDALVMALRTGEVDAMYDYSNPISPTMLPSISGVDGVDPGKGMNMGLFEILFGFQKQPTDDLEFRRAVRYALNYELLATTIGGEDGQVPGEGIISPQVLATMTAFPSTGEVIRKQARGDSGGGGVYRHRRRRLAGAAPSEPLCDVLGHTPVQCHQGGRYNQRIAEIIRYQSGERLASSAPWMRRVSSAIPTTSSSSGMTGPIEIYICYATQGVSFYKYAISVYGSMTILSMWGTCDLEDFRQPTTICSTPRGDEDYVAKVKELQRTCLGGGLSCIALCWDILPTTPNRHRQIRGMDELPRLGRHQLRDLV